MKAVAIPPGPFCQLLPRLQPLLIVMNTLYFFLCTRRNTRGNGRKRKPLEAREEDEEALDTQEGNKKGREKEKKKDSKRRKPEEGLE